MGCNFWNDDELKKVSDLENYRLRLDFIDKDNNYIIGDVSRGYKNRFYKKNGEPLKKYVRSHNNLLTTDFQIETEYGTYCYKTTIINDYIDKHDLRYNSKDLLQLINYLSIDQYDKIEVVER